ncbi:MAG: rRNA maturation RNase YbeY [Acaryochloris sp. RU_4_1]|nr:rRNA maturation RNase YbeY [Acaryochloris sp. RU_4_1]NJR53443.1 rRNA maturation RNase YbeY [Acaryochloris sp. CRU_2_0]
MQVAVHVQWDLDKPIQTTLASSGRLAEQFTAAKQISALTWNEWFGQWFICLQPEISPIHSYELSLLLTDNTHIQALNAAYRHQDRPTDVLAFAALDQQFLPTTLWSEVPVELGDIIISVETAALEAQEHHHTLAQELAWLATHGLLHLLGWDHPNPEQLNLMLHQQQKLLEQIGRSSRQLL